MPENPAHLDGPQIGHWVFQETIKRRKHIRYRIHSGCKIKNTPSAENRHNYSWCRDQGVAFFRVPIEKEVSNIPTGVTEWAPTTSGHRAKGISFFSPPSRLRVGSPSSASSLFVRFLSSEPWLSSGPRLKEVPALGSGQSFPCWGRDRQPQGNIKEPNQDMCLHRGFPSTCLPHENTQATPLAGSSICALGQNQA